MTLDSGLRRNDVQGIRLCPVIFEHGLVDDQQRRLVTLISQRHASCDPVTHRAGGVALSSQVFNLQNVSWVQHTLGPISDSDLHLTGKDDNVLPLGAGVPIAEAPIRETAEGRGVTSA